jgi:TonB family protein
MNAVLADLTPWLDAIGRSLLHFLWQGVLIGLVYVALRPLCTSIATRYRLGMGALLLMLVAPMLTLSWLRPVAGHLDDPIVTAVSTAVPAIGGAVDAATSTWLSQLRWEQALPWLVALWLVGVCVIATRSFLHWHRLARVVRSALPLPRDWQMRLIQLRQQFGVLRPVQLLSSIHVATPTLIGWLKPAILLPASLLSGFTTAQVELIIAHELSHVRRFDYIANLAQVVIETLLVYHPVVFWVSRDVRQARESCCDDLVLTLGGGDAMAYARTLADLEELHNDFGAAVPALGVGGGLLLARIRRIVDPAYSSALDPLPRGNGITLPMVLACAGLALALLRMHLIPATLVDALLARPSIDWAGNRVHLSLPAVTAITAAPIVPTLVRATIEPAQDAAQPVAFVDKAVLARAGAVLGPAAAASVAAETAAAGTVATPHIELPAAAISLPAPAVETKVPAVLARATSVAGPEPTQVVQARYPVDALRAGVTGKVDLDFRIASDGSVRDVRILHAQPSGIFDQAAMAAIRQWHFDVSGATDLERRYSRSFAFARAEQNQETCHEVTGSHICRRNGPDSPEN